jgi:hypothetical protein
VITSGAGIGGMSAHPRIAELQAEIEANPGPIVRDDISSVTGMTMHAAPVPPISLSTYTEADDILEARDRAAGLVPDDLYAVNQATDALSKDQMHRVLRFLSGYDTGAVAKAVAWVRDGKRI